MGRISDMAEQSFTKDRFRREQRQTLLMSIAIALLLLGISIGTMTLLSGTTEDVTNPPMIWTDGDGGLVDSPQVLLKVCYSPEQKTWAIAFEPQPTTQPSE